MKKLKSKKVVLAAVLFVIAMLCSACQFCATDNNLVSNIGDDTCILQIEGGV